MTIFNNSCKNNVSRTSKPWRAVLAFTLLLTDINALAAPISLTPADVAALPTVGTIVNANQDFFRGPVEIFVRTEFASGGTPNPSGVLTEDTLYRVVPILFASGSGNVQISNFGLTFNGITTIGTTASVTVSNASENFMFSLGFYISNFISPPFFGLFSANLSSPPNPDFTSFTSQFNSLVGLDSNLISNFEDIEIQALNVSSVPEPSTFLLMGLGLASLVFRRRKIT